LKVSNKKEPVVRAKWQKKSGRCTYWPVKYDNLYGHVQGPWIHHCLAIYIL